LKLTTDRHEASSSLSATAELLVVSNITGQRFNDIFRTDQLTSSGSQIMFSSLFWAKSDLNEDRRAKKPQMTGSAI